MFVFDLALCSAAFIQRMWCSEKANSDDRESLCFWSPRVYDTCVCVCVNCQWVEQKKKTPKTFYGTRPLTLNQHCKQRPTRSRDSLQQFSQDVFSPHLAVFVKNPHISVSDLLKKAKTLLTGIDPYTEPALSQCVCVCVYFRVDVLLWFCTVFVQRVGVFTFAE